MRSDKPDILREREGLGIGPSGTIGIFYLCKINCFFRLFGLFYLNNLQTIIREKNNQKFYKNLFLYIFSKIQIFFISRKIYNYINKSFETLIIFKTSLI